MKLLLAGFLLLLVSCGARDTLKVRSFHLQETDAEETRKRSENRFIRGEENKRLYGKVTAKERAEKKGRYYTASWARLAKDNPGAIKVIFEYRQSTKGAQSQKIVRTFPYRRSGKTEFQIIGANYERGGDVIAWRMSLYQGAELVSMKKSYLWD